MPLCGREKYLWLAAGASGLMMAYQHGGGDLFDVGFYAYVFMLLTLPSTREKIFSAPPRYP